MKPSILVISRNSGRRHPISVIDNPAAISLTPYACTAKHVGFGSALMGSQFDRIYVDDLPQTQREKDWLDHVRCRLSPGGEMIYAQ